MTKIKLAVALAILAALGGCASADKAVDSQNQLSRSSAVNGTWNLESDLIDGQTTNFDATAQFKLRFDAANQVFSMRTDCNTINGMYQVINGKILFHNALVTGMACDKEIVEHNLRRLLNAPKAFGVVAGSIFKLTSPNIGSANFVKRNDDKNQAELQIVSREEDRRLQDLLVGKTFIGDGKGGGLAVKLTLHFKKNRALECSSDFYQAFPKPVKTIGYYKVEDQVLTVGCHPQEFEKPIVWDFTVKNNGDELFFNHSDLEAEGSMKDNWMSLKKQ